MLSINKVLNRTYREYIGLKFHEKIYTFSLYIVYLLYILSFLTDKQYSDYINLIRFGLKYYVIIFLLIKFNPFIDSKCNNFDKIIIFQSAIFLLFTTNILNYI